MQIYKELGCKGFKKELESSVSQSSDISSIYI